MTLPDIPREAAVAIAYHPGCDCEDCRPVREAWPHLYAAALADFADRMDETLKTLGTGEDPLMAYRFVVACARSLADEATP